MDITKFYPSIDHNILKSIISRKIKDTKVLEILYEIIDSVNGINGIYGKGVPIGNYLSQYFANLYLTGFDHWCKEELKCRYYYRYADDIVILGESKAHFRMFLHYIAVNDIINIYDWYIGISVTNRELFVLHMSITGISLFIILYLYVKSHMKLTIEDSR